MGLRVKLGWALAVVVERDGSSLPVIVGRDELRVPPSRRIFGHHDALSSEPAERDAVIAGAVDRATDAATDLLAEAVADHDADVVAVVVGRGVRRIPVDRILASSQLFHTADAEILQEAFVEASARLGLPCERVQFREIEEHAAWSVVNNLGRVAGVPWRKDHKHAATAAWIALERA